MKDSNGIVVPSFGSSTYLSHLLPPEVALSKELLAQFEAEMRDVLSEVWEVYEAKGAVYDQASPVWHHFAFGIVSFASQVYIKATRFVSLLQGKQDVPLSEIDETLRDLIVYTIYGWAYARLYRATEGE